MNDNLRKELLSMEKEDQDVLQTLIDNGEIGIVEYHPKIKAIHEKNNRRIKEIINDYGWPGINLVGEDGADAVWLIVQHAVLDTKFMGFCVPLLRNVVNKKEAKPQHLAFLHDRVLTMAGKPQIYGTQHDIDEKGRLFPMPIDDSKNVNTRRQEVGLEPLEERTKILQEREDQIRKNRNKEDKS